MLLPLAVLLPLVLVLLVAPVLVPDVLGAAVPVPVPLPVDDAPQPATPTMTNAAMPNDASHPARDRRQPPVLPGVPAKYLIAISRLPPSLRDAVPAPWTAWHRPAALIASSTCPPGAACAKAAPTLRSPRAAALGAHARHPARAYPVRRAVLNLSRHTAAHAGAAARRPARARHVPRWQGVLYGSRDAAFSMNPAVHG